MLLANWLPLLKRAATQHGWTKVKWLLHYAGQLRGKALQESNLITTAEKQTCVEKDWTQ